MLLLSPAIYNPHNIAGIYNEPRCCATTTVRRKLQTLDGTSGGLTLLQTADGRIIRKPFHSNLGAGHELLLGGGGRHSDI